VAGPDYATESDYKASFVTGKVASVDGGKTAG
jgi:hypothetical protein